MNKLLVANRGEIAIRAFRCASELGNRTVAVYAPEDRESAYRLKADKAYELGSRGHPVRSYPDPGQVVELATNVGADAV
jgi:pyruvate carboxylase